jgi:hypothetical protein
MHSYASCPALHELMLWPYHTAGPLEGPQECPWGGEALRQGSWSAAQPHQAICALQGKEVREGSWQEEQPWVQGLRKLWAISIVITSYRVVAHFVALAWILKDIWRIFVPCLLVTGWARRQCSFAPLFIGRHILRCDWNCVVLSAGCTYCIT